MKTIVSELKHAALANTHRGKIARNSNAKKREAQADSIDELIPDQANSVDEPIWSRRAQMMNPFRAPRKLSKYLRKKLMKQVMLF